MTISLNLQAQTQNQDPILKKGQASPYDGILLKKERYSFLRARDEIASHLETENIELAISDGQKKSLISPTSACVIGVIVGAAIVYVTNPQGNSLTSFAAGAVGGGLLVLTFE